MKYRKKPAVVQALEWTGTNINEIGDFCKDKCTFEYSESAWIVGRGPVKVDLYIDTLEGRMHASEGDFIIKGIKGEFYPCKPDIFWETYEEVEK